MNQNHVSDNRSLSQSLDVIEVYAPPQADLNESLPSNSHRALYLMSAVFAACASIHIYDGAHNLDPNKHRNPAPNFVVSALSLGVSFAAFHFGMRLRSFNKDNSNIDQ